MAPGVNEIAKSPRTKSLEMMVTARVTIETATMVYNLNYIIIYTNSFLIILRSDDIL